MWAFRRDPVSLTPEEQQVLESLVEKIPDLKELYRVRVRFQEIFDTAPDRITAARWLRRLRRETERIGLDLGAFFETYDRWKTEILNYFDARQTSAAVETDERGGGGDQQQGAGDHQAGVWPEVRRQPVESPDPGPESGVRSDRLDDRADPTDRSRSEGPF
jgi:hypothetical protein